MHPTVAAIVATYNRKHLLIECIDALLSQTIPVDKILIVDNASTDGTQDAIRSHGYLSNSVIEYLRLPENTGGAGGFHEGLKRGQEAGYDWLWLMDDDAEPAVDALGKITKYFETPTISAVANLKVGRDGAPQLNHSGYINISRWGDSLADPLPESRLAEQAIDVTFSSFVGLAIRGSAVRKVGLPRSEFFIHHDDVEYCSRLLKTGRIVLATDSVIVHKDGQVSSNQKKYLLFPNAYRTPIDKLWLRYYGCRNAIWIKRRKYHSITAGTYLIRRFINKAIRILVQEDHKRLRIRFYWNAYMDGWHGRFENTKPKHLLQLKH